MTVTLDELHRKFGEVSEVAQLLETELGTLQLLLGAVCEGMLSETLEADKTRTTTLLQQINRQTLGQLIKKTNVYDGALAQIEDLLELALKERNRLTHQFFRQHNFRKFASDGREIMMEDLESIHVILLNAWKAVSLLSGVDLDKFAQDYSTVRENAEQSSSPNKLLHVKI